MPPACNHQSGDGYKQNGCRYHFPCFERTHRIGIDGCETRWPECLTQISRIGNDGIRQASQERDIWIDPAAQALRSHGDDSTGRRESEERKLLFHQPGKASLREDGGRFRSCQRTSRSAIAIRRRGQ